MIRAAVAPPPPGHPPEVSRLEGFSDAVFAFAVTLLVVSLEVPHTFDQFVDSMRGFPAFGICFLFLVLIWHAHFRLFRRFPLHDPWTVTLNSVLLFVVLFYVYPLKFLFTLLIAELTGFGPHAITAADIRPDQAPLLLTVYGAGFVAVYLVLAMLYGNAVRHASELQLDRLDLFDARSKRGEFLCTAGVGIVSISLAQFGGPRAQPWAGFTYFVLGPAMGAYGTISGRRRLRLEEALAKPPAGGRAQTLSE